MFKRIRLNFRNIALGCLFLLGASLVADGLWIKTKAVVAQVLLDRAFLSSPGENAKPWAWADVEPIAKVTSKRLAKSNIVLNNVSGEALAFGPGHISGTSLPGERGTVVFSAHRDTHFAWLGDLRKGDEIEVAVRDGETIKYRIRRAWIAEADASGINADSDENLIALTTCWPLNGTAQSKWRYIVEGIEIKEKAEDLSSI